MTLRPPRTAKILALLCALSVSAVKECMIKAFYELSVKHLETNSDGVIPVWSLKLLLK